MTAEKEKIKVKNGLGVSQFYNKRFKELSFEAEWFEFVGNPENNACWFVWGNSGNGKTSFACQLAKYLSKFGRVLYNSMEEGYSVSLKNAFQNAEISENDNITVLSKESISDLKERLRKPKSPKFVIIDSFQYSGLTALTYKALRNEFETHSFIFISHADGKNPSGRSARTAHYDADIKVWIEGFRAIAKSRYGGGKFFEIYKEGAEKYWITE